MNNPLLAICVPTYNRALNLGKLLPQLAVLKERHGDQLEICISNNGSSDETRAVIADFEREWPIQVQHQSTNIGGTLNIIAVAGQMRARWGIWCGDDDEVDALGIARILSFYSRSPRTLGYSSSRRTVKEVVNTCASLRMASIRLQLFAVHCFAADLTRWASWGYIFSRDRPCRRFNPFNSSMPGRGRIWSDCCDSSQGQVSAYTCCTRQLRGKPGVE